MNSDLKQIIIEKQKQLHADREFYEDVQTASGNDIEFYRYCEWKMQCLDDEMEINRQMLESGCVN